MRRRAAVDCVCLLRSSCRQTRQHAALGHALVRPAGYQQSLQSVLADAMSAPPAGPRRPPSRARAERRSEPPRRPQPAACPGLCCHEPGLQSGGRSQVGGALSGGWLTVGGSVPGERAHRRPRAGAVVVGRCRRPSRAGVGSLSVPSLLASVIRESPFRVPFLSAMLSCLSARGVAALTSAWHEPTATAPFSQSRSMSIGELERRESAGCGLDSIGRMCRLHRSRLEQEEDTGTFVAHQRGWSASRHGELPAVDPDQLSDSRRRLGPLGEHVAGSKRDETKVRARLGRHGHFESRAPRARRRASSASGARARAWRHARDSPRAFSRPRDATSAPERSATVPVRTRPGAESERSVSASSASRASSKLLERSYPLAILLQECLRLGERCVGRRHARSVLGHGQP